MNNSEDDDEGDFLLYLLKHKSKDDSEGNHRRDYLTYLPNCPKCPNRLKPDLYPFCPFFPYCPYRRYSRDHVGPTCKYPT